MDAPNEPASPAPRPRRLPRRGFLLGTAAGVAGAAGFEYAAPLEWNLWSAPPGTKISFAQNGEDLVAVGALDGVKVTVPTYLDVGAWEPIQSNNTYLFYRKGGRGVVVEPNVAMTPKLKRKRPRDVVLTAGIGIDATPEADYFVMEHSQLNTFDKEQADRVVREKITSLKAVVKMPLLNINAVMAEHFGGAAPDYLSVDTEGLELAILKTVDFTKFRPKVVCADSLVTGTLRHRPETLAFMLSQGYELRGMTYANTVFVDKALLGG